MPPKPASYKSFKPPRPIGAAGASSKASAKSKPAQGRETTVIDSSSDAAVNSDRGDDEENNSDVFMQEAVAKKPQDDEAAIPPKLIARLLHEHFAKEDTRITKHAMNVLAKYIEVFTLEAVGRANEERMEAARRESSIDGNFLEVSESKPVGRSRVSLITARSRILRSSHLNCCSISDRLCVLLSSHG